jgi:hypothetical protein
MERFFELHFLKVGDQTEFGMQTVIGVGHQRSIDVSALEELLGRLIAHRRAGASAAEPASAAA